MDTDPDLWLQDHIRSTIPLAGTIDITAHRQADGTVCLAAPLAPNVNDKGCAFAGALVSTMTLAGWSLLTLLLRDRGFACDVFVASSEVNYLAPVWTDFRATARFDETSDTDTFMRTLTTRGKARIVTRSTVRECGGTADCATQIARFVAKRRAPEAAAHAHD